ncbi:hypothetical protein NMG60_11036086 [Bertholletia excelsa]
MMDVKVREFIANTKSILCKPKATADSPQQSRRARTPFKLRTFGDWQFRRSRKDLICSCIQSIKPLDSLSQRRRPLYPGTPLNVD